MEWSLNVCWARVIRIMGRQPQLVIIGAGAAGMAAAVAAASYNIDTVVLDDQIALGGQIYKGIAASSAQLRDVLGSSYAKGYDLKNDLSGTSSVRWIHNAHVWQLERDGSVFYSSDHGAQQLKPDFVILANGALERAMPFPGWTLPGVMTAGAVQIALKTAQLVPDGKLVLAGSGPLLYLLAIQLVKAGGNIEALVDTTPRINQLRSVRYLLGMLRSPALLTEGMGLLSKLRKLPFKRYHQATNLKAQGEGGIEGLQFSVAGRAHKLDCDVLAIHSGVVPNVQLSRQLGLSHDWHDLARFWVPQLHNVSETELPWLHIAGDGGGVFGAQAAQLQGSIACLNIANKLNCIDPRLLTSRLTKYQQELKPLILARPFIDSLYAPAAEFLTPTDDTIVCRCEEVTAGDIRQYVELGCSGPNQTKAFGRPGMGLCQGRYCGLSVSEIIARQRGVSCEEVGYYRIRPPIKPIMLAELAAIATDD